MKRLYSKKIERRIEELTGVLQFNFRHIDGYGGWHQHLGSAKIGIVATAMGLLFYKAIAKECPEVDICLSFLKSKVLNDGGWSYISNASDRSNVESTCWALLALNSYRDIADADAIIEKGIEWLYNSIDTTNNDNGWSFSATPKPRIYLTAFALRTLYQLNKTDSPKFEAAKHWLINAQNIDGGWGATPEEASNLFFTCYTISTLLRIGQNRKSREIKNADRWLKGRFKDIDMSDPSLVCYLEFIEDGNDRNRVRVPFFHFVLPHIIETFIELDWNNHQLFDSTYSLFLKSDEGYIEHPDLENSRIYPIWALYDTGIAFLNFKKSRGASWKKNTSYVCYLNRIFPIQNFNPLKLLIIIPNWLWSVFVFFGVVFFVFHFGLEILNWWNGLVNQTLGQIIISFIASVLYGGCIWLFGFLKKKFV